MAQTFLKVMYHAFPVFSAASVVIAIISAVPLFKLITKWRNNRSYGNSQTKGTNNTVPFVLLICMVAFVFISAVIISISGLINGVFFTEVPNIVGKPINNADLILERHDLKIELPVFLDNADELESIVTMQLPEEGTIVRKGSIITIEYDIVPKPALDPDPEPDPDPDPESTPESNFTSEPNQTTKPDPTPELPTTPEQLPEPGLGDMSEQSSDEPSVKASCIPVLIPVTDKNADIEAYTSRAAVQVTIIAVSGETSFGPYDMKTNDNINWTFPADFYIEGDYTVTVTAYFEDGTTKTDSVSVTYPFPNSLF